MFDIVAPSLRMCGRGPDEPRLRTIVTNLTIASAVTRRDRKA
jgi:hypothetical protein